MLGIDGKEKPVYAEGAPVWVNLDGQRFAANIRGRSVEDIIDFWIVEFVDGSPHPETYPWSCAALPHGQLTPR